MFPRTIENRLKIGRYIPILRHQLARIEPCGDSVLTLEEMPILSGFVAYFEGNISTKIGLKICACIEKLNMGVVKIDLLA